MFRLGRTTHGTILLIKWGAGQKRLRGLLMTDGCGSAKIVAAEVLGYVLAGLLAEIQHLP